MRYISNHDTLEIFQIDGVPRYRFKQGMLVVGDATTNVGAANFIDVDDKTNFSEVVMRNYATDLKGNTTISIEMCGLGNLIKKDYAGAALDNLEDGFRGYFFEAPTIAGGTAVPAIAGIKYLVCAGTVTYNSVAYSKGESFITDGSATATTRTDDLGAFHLAIPRAITKECDPFLTEQFKIKNMKNGDESNSYWNRDTSGFNPMNSGTSGDANFFGWTR